MTLPTSYCSNDDVASILGLPGVMAMSDDDHSGGLSPSESLRVAQAISRTASLEINYYLSERYDLEAMSTNEWLRWSNAMLAAFDLISRRAQSVPKAMVERVITIRSHLKECRDTRGNIPDSTEANDWLPSVSNFEVERWREGSPVRVVQQESTRERPPSHVKRKTSDGYGWWL